MGEMRRGTSPPNTPERCWCDGSAYRPHPAGTDACRTPNAGRTPSCDCGHEAHPDAACACGCSAYRPETHPVAPDDSGCYGWPRACDHLDDLGCMEAEHV